MPSLFVRLVKARELSILLLMFAYIILVGAFNHEFVTGDTISLLIKASVILLVMAIGQSFALFTSNIDVSVGSIMGLSAAICGVLLTSGYNIWAVTAIVLTAGAIIGLINGVGVAFLKVPSIIMTLGMLGIIRGCMLIYTEGMWIEDIPNYYKKLAGVKLLGLNFPVWIAVILVILTHLFLTKIKFGRYFYAVGDNRDGARLVGIPVERVQLLAFMLSGISAAIAGMVFVMNIGFVPNQTGSGLELQVIAAAVLGGVSLTGGLGSVVGASLGAVFFTVINTSLIYLKIPAYWNNAISGLLLLLIVVGDSKFQLYLRKKAFSSKKKNATISIKGGTGLENENNAST
ncbi:sugar ABC transporter permease [Bacillus canaveralius]|uniref:Autoinducer 2 import system permease protein LsrC n=1 Tax=Bacillus canaveralius TaxID=1403243 RepID=A0A2N5GGE1_9BACI|nr:sugar ABC transporter permease [Bacillus canaveralius]PLR79819.1 sugar ABC transporter permease [Bacillus canaveralius]PLR93670.1 sugar ABC transporter permease [Bacillus canaveralius]